MARAKPIRSRWSYPQSRPAAASHAFTMHSHAHAPLRPAEVRRENLTRLLCPLNDVACRRIKQRVAAVVSSVLAVVEFRSYKLAAPRQSVLCQSQCKCSAGSLRCGVSPTCRRALSKDPGSRSTPKPGCNAASDALVRNAGRSIPATRLRADSVETVAKAA